MKRILRIIRIRTDTIRLSKVTSSPRESKTATSLFHKLEPCVKTETSLPFSIYSIKGKNIAMPKPSKTAAKKDTAIKRRILDLVRPNLPKLFRRINTLDQCFPGILQILGSSVLPCQRTRSSEPNLHVDEMGNPLNPIIHTGTELSHNLLQNTRITVCCKSTMRLR